MKTCPKCKKPYKKPTSIPQTWKDVKDKIITDKLNYEVEYFGEVPEGRESLHKTLMKAKKKLHIDKVKKRMAGLYGNSKDEVPVCSCGYKELTNKINQDNRKYNSELFLSRAKIPDMYLKGFDKLILNESAKDYCKKLYRDIESIVSSGGKILFSGDKGTGKTTTMSLILKKACKFYMCYWITAENLRNLEDESVWDYILSCQAVGIDELGACKYEGSDFKNRIGRLFEHCINKEIFLIATINKDLDKWISQHEWSKTGAFSDRIKNIFDNVPFRGDSLRQV